MHMKKNANEFATIFLLEMLVLRLTDDLKSPFFASIYFWKALGGLSELNLIFKVWLYIKIQA